MSLLNWVRQARGRAIRCLKLESVGAKVALQLAGAVIAAASLPSTTFAQATSTAERFFNSAGDAQNACTAEPVQYYCGTDGQLYQSGCNTIQSPHGGGGMSRVTRVEMSKAAGMGACYYSGGAAFKYTYFVWRDSPCPSGTKFVGPGANDCVSTSYTTYSQNNRKGCGGGGGGGGGGGNTCTASQRGDAKDTRGNPINTLVGNKTQREVDIDSGGAGVPGFVRTYNSFEDRNLAGLGVGWTHNWARKLERTGNSIEVIRSDGATQTFTGTGYGFWSGDPDTKFRMEAKETSYELSLQDGTVETYDRMGRLVTVRDAAGLTTTLDQSPGLLVSVTGPYGHKLTFGWTAGVLTSVTDAAGQTVRFTVDSVPNLTAANYPDGTSRTYFYEFYLLGHGLTGIIDGTGTRIATYSYDPVLLVAAGTSRAGGVDSQQVSFSADSMVAYITDAIGRVVTMVRNRMFGVNKTTAVTNNTDTKTVAKSYDGQGNLTSFTNEEGQVTASAYDSVNRLISVTRAYGTPIAYQTQINYVDAFFANALQIVEPSVKVGMSKSTTYTYGDARFPLLPTAATIAGYTTAGAPVSRTVNMGYTSNGQVSWIDGPRADVLDKTTIEYWDCSTGAACGQVRRVTNALSQVSTFDSYDGAGRPTQATSADGVVTTYAYNSRGKVTTISEAGGTLSRSMSMTYDAALRLSTTTMPTGRQLSYTYDGASQLLAVADQLGNTISYTYDSRGNRTGQTVKDGSGTIATQASMAYNARSQLQSITAAGATMQIGNDGVGNHATIQDPKGGVTTNTFDSLNRLWKSVNALGGQTTSSFTTGGDLAQLTAPNGAVFGFAVDDLQNRLQERSSDRGVINMTYDAAGNLKTKTDARGVTVSILYDALNRPTQISYPSASENVTYSYDSCRVGKLCGLTDASGAHSFLYDALGRKSQEVWTASTSLGGHVFTTSYTWTLFDKLQSVSSPSGRTVSYVYDALGRSVSAISAGQSLVSARAYRPDGALVAQTFGNSIQEARTYDTAGRLATWSIGSVETRTYSRDLNGNISAIAYGGTTKTHGYDALDRLISEPGAAMSWDANGNRLSDSAGSYSYVPGTNRVATSPAGAIGIDASGNTTMIGSRSFAYSEGGRLIQASNVGAVVGSYVYRADGLRAAKTASSATTLFHWDVDGNLLEETTTTGVAVRGYAWIDAAPIAQWTGSGPTAAVYLHTDHLGTPRVATATAGSVVWRWDGTAFGGGTPTGSAVVNLRFPGQYFDQETGFSQNWHRSYDASSGRYLESDPAGYGGGLNTYAYVNANPIGYVDPQGLWASQWGAYVHQRAGYLVFGSQITQEQLAIVARGHEWADSPAHQTEQFSFMHAMRHPGQSIQQACDQTNQFIGMVASQALDAKAKGSSDRAFFLFSVALHTMQDSTSPSHRGFQEWSNHESNFQIEEHIRAEIVYPGKGSTLDLITQEAWSAFQSGNLNSFRVDCGCEQ